MAARLRWDRHAGYFLQPDEWLRINLSLLKRFPEVAWIPGFWVEYGMAAEPSAFGTRIVWHHNQPPVHRAGTRGSGSTDWNRDIA
jgi:hypothetical protein